MCTSSETIVTTSSIITRQAVDQRADGDVLGGAHRPRVEPGDLADHRRDDVVLLALLGGGLLAVPALLGGRGHRFLGGVGGHLRRVVDPLDPADAGAEGEDERDRRPRRCRSRSRPVGSRLPNARIRTNDSAGMAGMSQAWVEHASALHQIELVEVDRCAGCGR